MNTFAFGAPTIRLYFYLCVVKVCSLPFVTGLLDQLRHDEQLVISISNYVLAHILQTIWYTRLAEHSVYEQMHTTDVQGSVCLPCCRYHNVSLHTLELRNNCNQLHKFTRGLRR